MPNLEQLTDRTKEILRESRDLVPLKSSRNIENVAISYSAVMAENGYIDHNALSS